MALPSQMLEEPILTEVASAGAGSRPLLSSSEQARKVAGAGRGPTPRATAPVLLTHKRGERDCFHKLVVDVSLPQKILQPLTARATVPPATVSGMASQVGLHQVITPATGNCLAMAIAQAATDAALDGPDRHLGLLTASLKREIKLSGLLDSKDQFAHDHRVHALAGVGRG